MQEFLETPFMIFILSVVPPLIAIIGAIVGVLKFVKGGKRLSYDHSSASLVSIGGDIQDRIEIRFDGAKVPSVDLFQVRIWNSGYAPIESEDYLDPISIRFSDNSRILSTKVKTKQRFEAPVSLSDSKVVLEKVPLNPKDEIIITTLFSEFDGRFSVDGRIKGQKELRGPEIRGRGETRAIFGLSAAFFILILIVFRAEFLESDIWGWIVRLLFTTYIAMICAYGALWAYRRLLSWI